MDELATTSDEEAKRCYQGIGEAIRDRIGPMFV